ncbi:hypothetical protein DICPUDRAFT_27692 [Dictyostelium purpureum]|uniref:EF-hand domain-containing protein n=1 Tax=Dictyostelium purpureum TaxID=5786 RepID=F0ZAJ9_DICPU|nr:uncharacterized protein DICPUDRAFT_27692 [Dictyostelium purpureum]EGC38985.1 hypothetical protein DICPUDRAFT_27692 [Dictyostelium purpureum]|eukprot:XP_003284438.1 hypothetical protein DICPUDRAFT_27692 [Dictyostelium purpureum]
MNINNTININKNNKEEQGEGNNIVLVDNHIIVEEDDSLNNNPDIEFLKKYDNNDLKHAIKSLTGVVVSDDFISILQKQIASNGNSEIDFEEFREAFSQIAKSLLPNYSDFSSTGNNSAGFIIGEDNGDNINNYGSNDKSRQSNPPSPPPTPQRSRSNSYSSSSQLSDLPSPPNSPRNSDSGSSSPFSFSPLSSSPPKYIYSNNGSGSPNNGSPPKYYTSTVGIYNKPPPMSPRRVPTSSANRPRSSSVRNTSSTTSSSSFNIYNTGTKNNNGVEPINDDQHIMLLSNQVISNSTFNSPNDKYKNKPQKPMNNNSNINNSGHYPHALPPYYSHTQNHHGHNHHHTHHHTHNNNLQSNQLFKSLLSVGDENPSDNKKLKKNNSNSSKKQQASSPKGSPNTSDNEDDNDNQFHMEIDWEKQLLNNNKKPNNNIKKYTYKINHDEDDTDNDSTFSHYSNNSSNFSSNNNSSFYSKKNKRNVNIQEEIPWATEEFYYDPMLTNLDDLHQIIAILKEKYTLYSGKSQELEKRVQTAIKANNRLEDDIDDIKKDCITLSLSNQALKKNNQLLEATIEYHSNSTAQIKMNYFNLEKENQLLKKRLQFFEDITEKNQKLLETTQKDLELKDQKYHSELEHLNTQYISTIQNVRKEYQLEFENEYRKNKELLSHSDKKKMQIELENSTLRQLLQQSNEKIESLENLYEEKLKQYQIHEEEKQSQSISQEILTTENLKLIEKIKKSELKKTRDVKNELKRTEEERNHHKIDDHLYYNLYYYYLLLFIIIYYYYYLTFCFFLDDSLLSSSKILDCFSLFVDSFNESLVDDSFKSLDKSFAIAVLVVSAAFVADVVVVVVVVVVVGKAVVGLFNKFAFAWFSSTSCGGIFSAKYSGFLMLMPYSLNACDKSSNVNTNALSFLVFSLDVPCNLILQNCKLSFVTSDINFCVASEINLLILISEHENPVLFK